MAKTVGKKGTCLNIGNCEKANSKESIIIKIGDNFICPDCGCELIEIKKESGNKLPLIIGAGGLIIVAITVAVYIIKFSEKEISINEPGKITVVDSIPENIGGKPEEITVVDSIIPGNTGVKPGGKTEPRLITDPPTNRQKGLIVKGGSYTGETKNGKPHGQGTLTYTSRTRISMKDMKERYAEAGQYFSGGFYEGEVDTGKLFDKNNVQIESITVGR